MIQIVGWIMSLDSTQKKLLSKALYTSPLMAVPSISPIMLRYNIPLDILMIAFGAQTLLVFVVWLVNIWLVPMSVARFSERQSNLWRYIASYAFALIIFITLREIMITWIESGASPIKVINLPNMDRSIPYYMIVLSFSVNSVILIIQDLVSIQEKKAIADLENSRLKLKNAEIINMELKQQLHPHFLFNALNMLKNLIRKEPNLAEDYLIRLSNFLRISISASKANTVRLEEELNMCIDYLEMQKTRFGNTLSYNIDIPEENAKKGYVPIFSIQLLLENVIKHNAMYKDAPLHIEVLYQVEKGRVQVVNNIQRRETMEVSTGMGLDNLSERYALISGDQVIIKSDEKQFSVIIKVLDHEGSYHRG